jgi:hypothetical protein
VMPAGLFGPLAGVVVLLLILAALRLLAIA